MNMQVNGQDPSQMSLGDQARLRDRIGFFNKNVDNTGVNAPDRASSHFCDENDRFNKDFAAIEKRERDLKNKRKQAAIDSKRVAKYERDLKRWEFMEEEQERQDQKVK